MSGKNPDKKIHIEKYDIHTYEKSKKPYVMICTDVIQRISMKNSQAFLMWSYLESLPPTWKPNKHHLMSHFEISARTYERHMQWLSTVGLIEYRQERYSDGSFGRGHLVILDGVNFNPDAENHGTVKIGKSLINKRKKSSSTRENTSSRTVKFGKTLINNEKQKVIHRKPSRIAKIGVAVQTSAARAITEEFGVSPERQITEVRCFGAHINKTKSFRKDIEKTNSIVPVFLDHETVKSHIDKLTEQRQQPLEEQTVLQGVYYAYETNPDKTTESILKRINIFLKKVREGQWLIPQGFEGITSQSIREKEEQQQAAKKAEYEQDKIAVRALVQASSVPGFKEMFAKIKGKADESINRRMQKVNRQTWNEAPSPA